MPATARSNTLSRARYKFSVHSPFPVNPQTPMDFWQRARSFAEEAARKSQELTQGIAAANLAGVVSEASKRSKELAAEASKKSKELAAEALRRADQITAHIPPPAAALSGFVEPSAVVDGGVGTADLEKYGVTDELREFVKEIAMDTFRDLPLADDSEMSDVPTVSNVRQDLTEWQERHAKLVLLNVKEISKLRYQLCPRVMKERKFWRIYFILVNSHVAPYEHCYNEHLKLKAAEIVKDIEVKEVSSGATPSKTADEGSKQRSSALKSPVSEQDLDVFLLGDMEDGDDGPDDGDDGFDDDFDKI
ncbi:BSD domain-containing protein [Striga asiatica]|uniref:BSD domain-containing protein n=1 Tax=Striga asiatica TaxID=4170 RepID=A0A5A7Q0D3_STRAF|nr:BSD domain-containing protein [Striga asiatica]